MEIQACQFLALARWSFQQMMRYQPNHHVYAGDKQATLAIKQNAKRRQKTTHSLSSSSISTALSTGVSTERFVLAQDSRLCGDLLDLSMHYKSIRLVDLVNGKNMQVCAYCKQKCSHICGLCGKAFHLTKPRNLPNITVPCFIEYHDECCFGLAYSDTSIASKRKKKELTYPIAAYLEGNRKEIRQLKQELM